MSEKTVIGPYTKTSLEVNMQIYLDSIVVY